MLGTFQKSHLRIEIETTESRIRESLLGSSQLQTWLWPQRFSPGLPEQLSEGLEFKSIVGVIEIKHYVDVVGSNCLRLLLSQGIDGFHEWYWGDGWIQSRLEGISMLPLNLGQTFSLLRLREFLVTSEKAVKF
ncbi:MAG: hypothetical protein F6K23_28635 [Okeania sp. SIO2C9]|uniref:hypothetical protein n=1 Tax=Okeania sp. SIO2C9 TaxID=2607791 RepID=UPI0013BFD04D|nr:hypothetical protein [Okeania sp. SIO2C9]NEQ76652.1 hypothetical protein [Okeania sp. SIO2C9]